MKKLLLFGLGGLMVILVAGVLIALSSINAIAKKAIQSGGAYALGTQVKVDSVSVGLLSGKLSLAGLEVANPAGAATFKSPHFLSLGHGGVAVSAGSLRQPVVELPTLTLDTLSINLEKSGEVTNYKTILDNLAKVSGGKDKPTAASGDDKKFIIRELDLRNINVSIDLIGGPGAVSNLTRVNVPIDHIQLSDVGRTGTGVKGTGVTLGELSAIIVKAILAAATDKGGDIIPGDILGELKGQLALLQGANLDELKLKVTGDVQKAADDLKDKVLDEGRKKLDEAADKLKGLLPGGDSKK